jgi:hypothetical protein
MISRKTIYMGAFLTLTVILIISFVLFPVLEEPPFPVVDEIKGEPELLALETINLIPEETSLPATTTKPPTATTDSSVTTTQITTTTPAITTTASPVVITTAVMTTTSPTTTTAPLDIDRIVEGNGYSFYRGPDGRLNLDWMVAPGGEVISYEEYGIRMRVDPLKPVGAKWIEVGVHFKMEGEQKYLWHDVLGWVKTGGVGTVTVMDVQSDGHRFYREPDGTVNLGKVITPDGGIISYEEYQIIKESR